MINLPRGLGILCVLPHRQLRIGQEENNRPAEQAVRSKTIKFRLGGFLFVYNRLYSLHFVLVKLQLGRFCPIVCQSEI